MVAPALMKLQERLRFCPYCAAGYEWQEGWPSEGPCAGCRRALAAEAEVARLRTNALLAGSLLDYCIGFLAEFSDPWAPGLRKKLVDARAALAAKETT